MPSNIRVGDQLPALQLGPVDRTTLALFGGASGDHNPIHIDLDFARKAGMKDVFAHGMLSMAFLGRLMANDVAKLKVSGKALYTWPNGSRYEGEYDNDLPHGIGTLRDGRTLQIYEGEWNKGCFKQGSRRAWLFVEEAACK